MSRTIHGVVRGKTIELEENLGVAEGQRVEIKIGSVPSQRPWGEGLRPCRGFGERLDRGGGSYPGRDSGR